MKIDNRNIFIWFFSLIFSTIVGNKLVAQPWQNLISNYSFERHDLSEWNAKLHCGNDPTGEFPHRYQYEKDYWEPINDWTHPLKRKFCMSLENPQLPTADLYDISCWPSNKARSGGSWGHTSGEYLISPVNYSNGGLQPNKAYYIEVFHKGYGDKEKVIAYDKQPKACGWAKRLYEYNTNKPYNFLLEFNASNSSGWTRFRGYFSPTTDKKWLSFGNSGEWDDLRIYEVQPNKCRTNWYFDNTVFNYPMEVFQVSGKVYLRNGVDPENGSNHILGNVIQYANSKVVLRGGNRFKI